MSSGMTTAEATQVGAKTLWIGDIEPWMDENYISSLFTGVSISALINSYRLRKLYRSNSSETRSRAHLSVSESYL